MGSFAHAEDGPGGGGGNPAVYEHQEKCPGTPGLDPIHGVTKKGIDRLKKEGVAVEYFPEAES